MNDKQKDEWEALKIIFVAWLVIVAFAMIMNKFVV